MMEIPDGEGKEDFLERGLSDEVPLLPEREKKILGDDTADISVFTPRERNERGKMIFSPFGPTMHYGIIK